jgi:hypothetical protein
MLDWVLNLLFGSGAGAGTCKYVRTFGFQIKVVGFFNTLSYCQLFHGNCSHGERMVGVLVYFEVMA